jgi:hypothetical protein
MAVDFDRGRDSTMPQNVMCRAELHGSPTREQYAAFHAGMGGYGLGQTITQNGKVFRLPTGEYFGSDLSDSLAILSLKVSFLAIQITGESCKLMLAHVSPEDTFVSGLEEVPSYATELGSWASIFSALSAPKP